MEGCQGKKGCFVFDKSCPGNGRGLSGGGGYGWTLCFIA
jgi:hypothetical protein